MIRYPERLAPDGWHWLLTRLLVVASLLAVLLVVGWW